MATPFTLLGTLNLPGTPGLPADPIPFGVSVAYDSKSSFEYNLPSSSGIKVVDFGTMPSSGVKALLITYDGTPPLGGGATPPVSFTLNGGVTVYELSSGGFLCLGSPVPVAGITAMSISYTGAGKVRVWLLG